MIVNVCECASFFFGGSCHSRHFKRQRIRTLRGNTPLWHLQPAGDDDPEMLVAGTRYRWKKHTADVLQSCWYCFWAQAGEITPQTINLFVCLFVRLFVRLCYLFVCLCHGLFLLYGANRSHSGWSVDVWLVLGSSSRIISKRPCVWDR